MAPLAPTSCGSCVLFQPMFPPQTTTTITHPMMMCDKQQQCGKRNVRFTSSTPEIVFVDKRTDEEQRERWYSEKDYTLFENDCKESVEAARNNGCYERLRGLERCVSFDFFIKAKHRLKTSIQRVLDEQQYQRYYGLNDPDAIRDISMVCCEWEKEQALRQAEADAYEASISRDNSDDDRTTTTTVSSSSSSSKRRKYNDECQYQAAEKLLGLATICQNTLNRNIGCKNNNTSSSPTKVNDFSSTDWLHIGGENQNNYNGGDCQIYQPNLVLLSPLRT